MSNRMFPCAKFDEVYSADEISCDRTLFGLNVINDALTVLRENKTCEIDWAFLLS